MPRKPPAPPRIFGLSAGRYLIVSMGDITQWKGDAIVNAANEQMLGGSGVDGAIHRAAGRELRRACEKVPPIPGTSIRCPTGQARLTNGYQLPAKFVIHTVGPIYSSKSKSEPLLSAAYESTLQLATDHNLMSIAFPAISCGIYGYPLQAAAEIAIDACISIPSTSSLQTIEFVMFGSDTYNAWIDAAKLLHLAEVDHITGYDEL